MTIKRYKTFRGGYRFENFAGQPEGKIVSLPAPQTVIIPLRQGFGDEVQPVVKAGDRVKAGQIIGVDDGNISSPVHATISGHVRELPKKNYFRKDVTFVVIDGDGADESEDVGGPDYKNWESYTDEELESKLYLSGVTGLGKSGIPTRYRSSVIMPGDVEHLIIHGIGSEVYNVSVDRILEGRKMFAFVEGIRILKKLLPRAGVFLALNNGEKKLVEELRALTSGIPGLELALLEPKYPQGYDEMLIPALTGNPFPYGYSASNIGIISLNIRSVLLVQQAVAENKPLTEVVIGLCGPGFKENPHLKVRVGTTLDEVVKNYVSPGRKRLVFNSLLTGPELNDYSLPVDRANSHIIAIPENSGGQLFAFLRAGMHSYSYSSAFLTSRRLEKRPDTNVRGEGRPCISCGYCEQICPVRIIPHLLSRMTKRGFIDERLMRYGIFTCIDCNLCSFVCPCKIPLAEHIREGKEKLIGSGCDQSLCILPYFELKGIEEYRGIKW